MRKLFILVLSLIFVISVYAKEKVISNIQTRNGLTYEVDQSEPFTGLHVQSVYGMKVSEIHYKNGVLDGLFVGYYKNGQKQKEASYKNGKLEGLMIEYYKNGLRKLEVSMKSDKPEGILTSYFKNGQKQKQATIKNEKPVGIVTQWNFNGEIVKKYDADKVYSEKEKKEAKKVWSKKVKDHIARKFHKPPKTGESVATVTILVSRGGYIVASDKKVNCKGSNGFCNAVDFALESAEPLPNPPVEYNLNKLERTMTFTMD